MIHPKGPPLQAWRTFLANHLGETIGIDLFTVPTATFRVLFVILVLSHARRRIVHFNVTAHPSAIWTAQELLEACGVDQYPRFLVRDRDAVYGRVFTQKAAALGIVEVPPAVCSPWQNPYAERVIGSIRRECLDHVVVLGERQLKGLLRGYVEYYHRARTHLSVEKDAPEGRPVQPIGNGTVVELSHLGGLHHEYVRSAA